MPGPATIAPARGAGRSLGTETPWRNRRSSSSRWPKSPTSSSRSTGRGTCFGRLRLKKWRTRRSVRSTRPSRSRKRSRPGTGSGRGRTSTSPSGRGTNGTPDATTRARAFCASSEASVSEKIHYLLFRDRDAASAAEERLGRYGSVRIDADKDDEGPYWLVIGSTAVDKSPPDEDLEALAEELGGEYDGSETEVEA